MLDEILTDLANQLCTERWTMVLAYFTKRAWISHHFPQTRLVGIGSRTAMPATRSGADGLKGGIVDFDQIQRRL